MSFLTQLLTWCTSAKGAAVSVKQVLSTARGAITTVKGAQKALIEKEWAKAQQGNPEAQFSLGERFYEGRGIHQNYASASQWFERAACQGHGRAQANLGMMLFLGRGVPVDFVAAIQWLTLACWQKDEVALRSWRIAVRKATSEQIAQGQKRAESFQIQKENSG